MSSADAYSIVFLASEFEFIWGYENQAQYDLNNLRLVI